MSNAYLIKKCDRLSFEIIKIRDGNMCQVCGRRNTLVPSHCYGKKAYPNLRHEIGNILTLCNDCHANWWHQHYTEAMTWWRDEWPERAHYVDSIKNLNPKLNRIHYQELAQKLKVTLEDLRLQSDWGKL